LVRQRIASAAIEAGRLPQDITLVAVSKTFEASAIEPVIAAGQRIFGENRVQESKAKWPALKARFPDIKLHLIGPLQSNKAAEAVALFDCIQSLDREKLARVLADEIQRQGRHPELFIEINSGEEGQKAYGAMTPLQRMADPAEIGAVAAFLASSDSGFMTASEVAVDGGLAQL